MKLPIILLLPAFVFLAEAWTTGYDEAIRDFKWPQDSKDFSSFSSRQDVRFVNSYFENFSKTIGEQLLNMENLTFNSGHVSQLYVKQNILELSMWETNTENIEIDPDEEYAIVELRVDHCKLTTIPKNINLLKRLEILELGYNQIDHVKMNDLNDLNNLKELQLYGNGMKTLSSEPTIHLPKLSYLSIYNNKLQEINVCSWNMPVLEYLKLNENKLRFVVHLADQFPKLQIIDIFSNPLVCSWKENLVRSLKSKRISAGFIPPTCNATDETPVPIECPTVYSLSNQLSDVLQLLHSFEQSMGNSTKKTESLEQMMKKSNDENKSLMDRLQQIEKRSNEESQSFIKHFQQMEKKSNEDIQSLTDRLQQMEKKSNEDIESLTTQLTQQRHSFDDLTEAFYRYVLEKDGGEK